MKFKVYIDHDLIRTVLNERLMTNNFTWDKYIPWLFGFYKLEKVDHWKSEQQYTECESSIFKLLLLPFKLVGSIFFFLLYRTLFCIIFPFFALGAIRFRREGHACERSCIRQDSGVRDELEGKEI